MELRGSGPGDSRPVAAVPHTPVYLHPSISTQTYLHLSISTPQYIYTEKDRDQDRVSSEDRQLCCNLVTNMNSLKEILTPESIVNNNTNNNDTVSC